ncbi:MAG: hypothetical protein LBJ96_00345 [Holosporaceae bacterium]|jgi:hypothetical protein|nr:hypothetical protein [Holosporaceae bacterium]
MFRFLLIFLLLIFLGVNTNNSRQLVFSLEEQSDEENNEAESKEGEESSDNSDGEDSTEESADNEPKAKAIPPQVRKKHVRSIVDNVLSINKHVDHAKKRRKSKKKQTDESKEEDSTEEENSVKKNSTKEDSVKEDVDNNDDNEADGASKKEKDAQNKSKSKSERRRKSGRSAAYSSKRIYTVKNVYLPRDATNRYLSRNYRGRGYGGSGEYRIKSYGSSDNNAKYVPKSYANVKSEEKPPEDIKPKESENVNPPEEKSKSVSQCFSFGGCHR